MVSFAPQVNMANLINAQLIQSHMSISVYNILINYVFQDFFWYFIKVLLTNHTQFSRKFT